MRINEGLELLFHAILDLVKCIVFSESALL